MLALAGHKFVILEFQYALRKLVLAKRKFLGNREIMGHFISKGTSMSWEKDYVRSPPWDIHAPQPEIVKLAENNEIKGARVLDIGCGLGDNAIFLAKKGFLVTGIDIAQLAIEKGKKRAAKQGVTVDFRVGDVFRLDDYFEEESFDTVLDSGLFHSLDDEEKLPFAKQVWKVLVNGGKYFLLCFSDTEQGSEKPKGINKEEIRRTFSKTFRVDYLRDAFVAAKIRDGGAGGYIASMTKIVNANG